jgi:protocatechuate 3,4-dioxygenase alpha subunit
MSKLKQTPSQTVGPYFAYGLTPEQYGYPMSSIAGSALTRSDTEGERIRIEGRVLDGEGTPINDALIEIWQADAHGRYAHPADPRGSNASFKGFGRCGTGTDPECRYWFDTVKPGSIDGRQAPHINVTVLMRGMLLHAFTRIYFSDEAAANAKDPVLEEVPAGRRDTLIAKREQSPAGTIYRFDIRMQGAQETVFFDV